MKKVGIKQVAEKAGVSVATVSYVMNGSGRVSEKTKKHVIAVAKELGFVRDDTAARLRTGQSKLLGVILNNIENPFFSELVAGIELAAYRLGYLTLISTAQNDHERQTKLLQSMVSQGVGAVILSPVHETTDADLRVAHHRSIPIVSCVRDVPSSSASFVGVDEEMSGYLAARALLEVGHQTITFIGGYDHTTTWLGRRNGIFRALGEAGLPQDACRLFPGPLSREFASKTATDLIDSHALGGAVMVFNDDMATGLYSALRYHRMVVGWDISVISFDNVPVGSALEPQLTTVEIFPRKIGETSAEMAIELIRTNELARQERVFVPELVTRHSLKKRP